MFISLNVLLLQTEYLPLTSIAVNGVFVWALKIFVLDCNCCEMNICIDREEKTHSDSYWYVQKGHFAPICAHSLTGSFLQ